MKTTRKIKKQNVLIAVIIITLPLIIYICFNLSSIKTVSDGNIENFKAIDNRWEQKGRIKDISNNIVIIIGDSRMEFLSDRGNSIEIPTNFSFIALGDTKISWFNNQAVHILKKSIDNNNDINYHVILNMGVNDLNDSNDPLIHSENYFRIYKKLAQNYKDVNFYVLSVNPLDMSIINTKIYNQKRTNSKIEIFNDNMIKNINNSNLNNMHYCDSYHNVEFVTRDGLHYNKKTDQNIVNYLTKSCLKY